MQGTCPLSAVYQRDQIRGAQSRVALRLAAPALYLGRRFGVSTAHIERLRILAARAPDQPAAVFRAGALINPHRFTKQGFGIRITALTRVQRPQPAKRIGHLRRIAPHPRHHTLDLGAQQDFRIDMAALLHQSARPVKFA